MPRCACFSPPAPEVIPVAIATEPIDGQKPGTSGLRKSTQMFMEKNYTENFVAAMLEAMGACLKRSTLVIGGDGRFYCIEAALKIIQMCAAYGVSYFKQRCLK
ncbi:Phosphoglucomutase [Lamellibrachia satsuma]|nr:Phosphoglucomutase [Lamellibrachia satsuma]